MLPQLGSQFLFADHSQLSVLPSRAIRCQTPQSVALRFIQQKSLQLDFLIRELRLQSLLLVDQLAENLLTGQALLPELHQLVHLEV